MSFSSHWSLLMSVCPKHVSLFFLHHLPYMGKNTGILLLIILQLAYMNGSVYKYMIEGIECQAELILIIELVLAFRLSFSYQKHHVFLLSLKNIFCVKCFVSMFLWDSYCRNNCWCVFRHTFFNAVALIFW